MPPKRKVEATVADSQPAKRGRKPRTGAADADHKETTTSKVDQVPAATGKRGTRSAASKQSKPVEQTPPEPPKPSKRAGGVRKAKAPEPEPEPEPEAEAELDEQQPEAAEEVETKPVHKSEPVAKKRGRQAAKATKSEAVPVEDEVPVKRGKRAAAVEVPAEPENEPEEKETKKSGKRQKAAAVAPAKSSKAAPAKKEGSRRQLRSTPAADPVEDKSEEVTESEEEPKPAKSQRKGKKEPPKSKIEEPESKVEAKSSKDDKKGRRTRGAKVAVEAPVDEEPAKDKTDEDTEPEPKSDTEPKSKVSKKQKGKTQVSFEDDKKEDSDDKKEDNVEDKLEQDDKVVSQPEEQSNKRAGRKGKKAPKEKVKAKDDNEQEDNEETGASPSKNYADKEETTIQPEVIERPRRRGRPRKSAKEEAEEQKASDVDDKPEAETVKHVHNKSVATQEEEQVVAETQVKDNKQESKEDKKTNGGDHGLDESMNVVYSEVDDNDKDNSPLNDTITVFENSLKRKSSIDSFNDSKKLLSEYIGAQLPAVSGKVFVFGDDIAGELGMGEIGLSKGKPAHLKLEESIASICSRSQHNVLITSKGSIYTFGCNDEFALGRNTANQEEPEVFESTPHKVPLGVMKVVKASAGDSHTAVLSNLGSVYIWGNFRDSNGSVGLTEDKDEPIIEPTPLGFEQNYVDIASGGNFLLLLHKNGTVYSLGVGDRGELGRLTEDQLKFDKKNRALYLNPGEVKFKDENVICDKIWCGEYCAFARTTDNKIFAWGLNNYSQLGFKPDASKDQDHLYESLPTEVPLLSKLDARIEKITTGQHHSLALDDEGRIYSFGRHEYGRLGQGELTEELHVPTVIDQLKDERIVDIACGQATSFAVTENGHLYSWGMASSQLGLGSDCDDDAMIPTRVVTKYLNSAQVVSVAAGSQHTMIIAVDNDDNKQ